MMNIRKLLPADIQAYWLLRVRALREHPDAFGMLEGYEEQHSLKRVTEAFRWTSEDYVLGAFNDARELVGMAAFTRETEPRFRHIGIVWGMYVARPYQRQGLGRRLLREVLRLAEQANGLARVHLYVAEGNQAAIRMYASIGFTACGMVRNTMEVAEGRFVNEIRMAKALKGEQG